MDLYMKCTLHECIVLRLFNINPPMLTFACIVRAACQTEMPLLFTFLLANYNLHGRVLFSIICG